MKTAIITLSLLVAAGIGVTAAAGKTTARTLSWHLVEKDAAFNFVDNPPRQGNDAPPLMGDHFALRSELLTRAGKHAGWLNATCTVTSGGERGVAPCYGVFSLQGGHLMAMTLLSFASGTAHVAIVGGTGVYRGATGNIESVSRGPESGFSDDTIHLVLP